MTTTYRFERLSEQEIAHWNELIARYEGRELFHQRAWLDYLAASRGMEIALWAIRDRDETVGYFSGGIFQKGPFRILGSPLRSWGTNFMGPVVNRDIDQPALIDAVDELARTESFAMFEVEHPGLSEPVMESAGFSSVADWTYMVDITPGDADSMWRALDSTCRNRIRKAMSAGLTVEDVDDPSIADEYYDQYREMMRSKATIPSFPREHPALLVTHLKKADALFALCVRDKRGAVLATGLFPHDNRTMYFWSGASWRLTHELCPNDYLHWRAMCLAAERGLTTYNMCGYGRFKRKFGGRLKVVKRWHKCYWPTARLGRRVFELWHERRAMLVERWQRLVHEGRRPSPNGDARTAEPRPVAARKSTKYDTSWLEDIWRSPLHDFPIRDELLHQFFVFPPDAKMLEVGPGSGFTAFWLARNVRHLTVAEVAPGNVSKLQTAFRGVKNVCVARADVCVPGLVRKIGDGFDAAYAIEVFEFLTDPAACLKNLASILRPDGQLLLQFPNYPPARSQGITYFRERDDLDRLMRQAGFAYWDVYALRLRRFADVLYRIFHERPIALYRHHRERRGPALPLNYDEVWTFQHGSRLESYKYALHGAWALLAAAIRAGGPCFAREPLGDAIVNRNLLVVARR